MSDPVLENRNDTSSMARLVYILYLAGLVVGISGIVGVVIAYINQSDSDEWLQSHYRFQIRTFWIGLLYIVVGSLLSIILIGWLVLLFWVIWLIIRCVKGFQLIDRRLPHPDPATWMF